MKINDIILNTDDLINDFIALASVSGISRNEAEIAAVIEKRMQAIGACINYDNISDIIGGNTNNMLITIPASDEQMAQLDPIMFCQHMDTVEDTKELKANVDDKCIKSDGTTILGADNRGAITSILNALEYLHRNRLPHREIEVLITVAEELGVMGSSALDYSMFKSKQAIVMDGGGRMGKIYKSAPEHYNISFNFKGKSAHAGMAPESGISAISMAANAISRMPLSRIDHETTANIGVIQGGEATNVVTDSVHVKGEARSRSHEKTVAQLTAMENAAKTAAKEMGGTVDVSIELMYPPFNISCNHPLYEKISELYAELGIKAEAADTGGGSDANYLNKNGIYALLLSAGYENPHSKDECFFIEELINFTKIIVILCHTPLTNGK